MSIYSGFATRQIEQTYNIMVEQLFRVLQKRILKFYRGEDVNENIFGDCIKKLLTQMSFFERQKHLPPKFSDNCKELATFLKIVVPSNVSLFGTKKSREVSQQQLVKQIEGNKDTIIDQEQQIQQQNLDYSTLHYGEPQKSQINMKKIHHQHSLFSTNSSQINQPEQMQLIQGKDGSNKYRENKQNFITLEAAYNNSSSSVSPNASLHSSLGSLKKKNISNNNKQDSKQPSQDQSLKKRELNPQRKEAQMNLVKQIVQGQKKIIQTMNHQNINKDSQNGSDDDKKGNLRDNQPEKVSENKQENNQQQQREVNGNSLKQFRVIKKQQPQQQNNGILPSSQSIQLSQGNSPSKIIAPVTENNLVLQNDFQTIQDDIQLLPHMNKKKNRRSHTTKRQRKRNQILNHIYLNGDEFSNVQNGSHTMLTNINSRRSRSSYRSSEQPQRNSLFQNNLIDNLLQRSDSIDANTNPLFLKNQENSSAERQLGLNKIIKESNHPSQDSTTRNTSYNPAIAGNNSKQTTSNNTITNFSNNNQQQLRKQGSDGQISQSSSQQLHSQNNPLSTPSDYTVYSMRQQIVEQMGKVNSSSGLGNNQSIMIESSNSRLARQKLDFASIQNDTDEEPKISRLNTQNNSQQGKFTDNNSSAELKNIFYPFSGTNTTKNRTPQKHRILQNSSLNNSLMNTQNTFKQNNQSIDSSQFNQMYKNQSKRQSNSHLYSQHFSKQINSQNSSGKKLYGIDSVNVIKTSNAALDQSTSDEQFKNNSSFNTSNISKRENTSPLKNKVQYKFIVNKQQLERSKRDPSPSNLQKENKPTTLNKLNNGNNKKPNEN